MTLTELYRRLSLGPLSNLAVGNEGSGTLTDKGKSQALLHLNTALRNLSGRFTLSSGAVLVRGMEGVADYALRVENSYTVQSEETPAGTSYYIMDTESAPFDGRVVSILSVWVDNQELPLNELDNPYSVHAAGDTFTIPYRWYDQTFSVMYQRYLDEIPAGNDTLVVPIPVPLETALVDFIASEFYSGMNSQENIARGQLHRNKYESECLLVEEKNLLGDTFIASLLKFDRRGFV